MKIAIVTGASSGLGREFARQLVAEFPEVEQLWLIARRKDKLEDVAASLPRPALCLGLDLCDPMVAGFFDIICNHIFKWQHTFNIQIPSTGNKILLIGVFGCQLVADKMAAVIKILSVNIVIFNSVPAGRFYLADFTALLCWHCFGANICISKATPAQTVKGAICLKSGGCQIRICKIRIIVIGSYIRLVRKFRYRIQ